MRCLMTRVWERCRTRPAVVLGDGTHCRWSLQTPEHLQVHHVAGCDRIYTHHHISIHFHLSISIYPFPSILFSILFIPFIYPFHSFSVHLIVVHFNPFHCLPPSIKVWTAASIPMASSALSSCQISTVQDSQRKNILTATCCHKHEECTAFRSSSLLGARVWAAGNRILHRWLFVKPSCTAWEQSLSKYPASHSWPFCISNPSKMLCLWNCMTPICLCLPNAVCILQYWHVTTLNLRIGTVVYYPHGLYNSNNCIWNSHRSLCQMRSCLAARPTYNPNRSYLGMYAISSRSDHGWSMSAITQTKTGNTIVHLNGRRKPHAWACYNHIDLENASCGAMRCNAVQCGAMSS